MYCCTRIDIYVLWYLTDHRAGIEVSGADADVWMRAVAGCYFLSALVNDQAAVMCWLVMSSCAVRGSLMHTHQCSMDQGKGCFEKGIPHMPIVVRLQRHAYEPEMSRARWTDCIELFIKWMQFIIWGLVPKRCINVKLLLGSLLSFFLSGPDLLFQVLFSENNVLLKVFFLLHRLAHVTSLKVVLNAQHVLHRPLLSSQVSGSLLLTSVSPQHSTDV